MPIEIILILFSIFILLQIVIGFWLVKKFNEFKTSADNLKQASVNNSQGNSSLNNGPTKQDLDWQQKWQEEEKATRQRILDLQENIDRKETQLNLKLEKLENDKEKIEETKNTLRDIKSNLLQKTDEIKQKEQELIEKYQVELASIAKLSSAEAKNLILKQAKQEVGSDLLEWQQKFIENKREESNLEAREIVALAVQRCSSEVANEYTLTTIKLQSEEDKGKLIGKGGRNIQWIEKTLGVELVIDDTPEVITISGFSSIRRHIAKKTLEKLLEDGRIHPASIEDTHEKAKAEIAQEIAASGEYAVNQLGIIDFPAKLVRLIGRLKFRTSYGQNQLGHSLEMAKLAALLAEEFNARFPHREKPVDVQICIKGALLHDIGKGIDEEQTPKGNHIQLGEKICDTFGLDWRIKKCISSHHDESYWDAEHGFCIEAAIVDACDNISGSRLGARKETAQAYYERMENLETIAMTSTGVNKAWIMKGSRELWVFFDTQQVTPSQMYDITREITDKIETQVNYAGEIKVIGIWEDKIIEYAR